MNRSVQTTGACVIFLFLLCNSLSSLQLSLDIFPLLFLTRAFIINRQTERYTCTYRFFSEIKCERDKRTKKERHNWTGARCFPFSFFLSACVVRFSLSSSYLNEASPGSEWSSSSRSHEVGRDNDAQALSPVQSRSSSALFNTLRISNIHADSYLYLSMICDSLQLPSYLSISLHLSIYICRSISLYTGEVDACVRTRVGVLGSSSGLRAETDVAGRQALLQREGWKLRRDVQRYLRNYTSANTSVRVDSLMFATERQCLTVQFQWISWLKCLHLNVTGAEREREKYVRECSGVHTLDQRKKSLHREFFFLSFSLSLRDS